MEPFNPIQLRREIHKNPELYFQETKTTELLISNINKLIKKNDILIKSQNIKISILKPLSTGLIIEYLGDEENLDWLIFRADIDALPITEATNLPFKSENGCMHACGHDLHTAILYGFFEEVLKTAPKKNFLFLFQPAEEEGGGAQKILVSDVFHKYQNIKGCFALHITDEWEVGTIASNEGTLFAAAHAFDVNFVGRESHLAFPEMGINAFSALRLFLDKADAWLLNHRNEVPTLLWGIGKIGAGHVRNILPGNASLSGSLRALKRGETDFFFSILEKLLKEVEIETNVKGEIKTVSFYPALINSSEIYHNIKGSLEKNFNFIETPAKMTGEDFGFFSEKYPSLMVWLGGREKGESAGSRKGLHHPEFSPSENAILEGIKYFHLMSEIN